MRLKVTLKLVNVILYVLITDWTIHEIFNSAQFQVVSIWYQNCLSVNHYYLKYLQLQSYIHVF